MTGPDLRWRYVAAVPCPCDSGHHGLACPKGRPAYLIAGPVPLGGGETRSERATCAWLWERLSERAPCPLGDKCQRDATFTGHSGLGQLNCTVCKSKGWVRVLRAVCPYCTGDGNDTLCRCKVCNRQDGTLAVVSLRPVTDAERPECGRCMGSGVMDCLELNGECLQCRQSAHSCSDCAGTGREPGMWIVGELP